MTGIVEHGDVVTSVPASSYSLGDIVVYRHGEGYNIKQVIGVPGDTFKFTYGKLQVNDVDVSANSDFFNLIMIYADEYSGVIPDKTYLINGTTTSSMIGFISIVDILGRLNR